MATTRVYKLAKELGVKSKAIVEKCQHEGLDVKNHMSTISAGLAATIREWFSEGDNITTEEVSDKVDLDKVRIKPKKKTRRKKTAKSQKEKCEESAEPEMAVEPDEDELKANRETAVEEPVEKLPVSEETIEQPQQAEAPAAQVQKPETEQKPPELEEEPQPIKPAGPMLESPKPAQLSGPRLIRYEKPEPEPAKPRPKPRRKPRHETPLTESLMKGVEETQTPSRAPGGKGGGRRKRSKERTHGRRHEGAEDTQRTKSKFGGARRQRDLEERQARLSAAIGEGKRLRPMRKIVSKSTARSGATAKTKTATVNEPITVKDLSSALGVKSAEIITKLMQQGVMATANQAISPEVAELVAIEFGTELKVERKQRLEEQLKSEFENRERKKLQKRPVVATMLGHVDHGKTSLLDKIRSSKVAAGEAGGITQHIGAYQIHFSGNTVTFLDTPGHEAFTAMRARGANMTDVVVLVVAADDGIMPQTVEAISHAKAANVPVIVALNKIDLPGCDINRIYSQLSEQELTPTEWGGETDVVKTSAVTGEGIDDLLDHIQYLGELLELKADNTIPATGYVIEARMSRQRGPVATLMPREGTLSHGDIILSGVAYGRVKTLRDCNGEDVEKVTSVMPAEITGLNQVPQAGDPFYCLADFNKAKNAAEEAEQHIREDVLAQRSKVTLDNLFTQIEAGNVKELNLIIRADVQGSVDVLKEYLAQLSTDEVRIKILHAAPGGITEGDVLLAEASNAIIIGFNVACEEHVAKQAEAAGVDIRSYKVIYHLTDEIQKAMAGLLEPEKQEKSVGRAVVRDTFKISRVGTIAGCYVSDGVVKKNSKVRLVRDNVVIRDGIKVESLKHFKDDVREVKSGMECGVKLERFDDVKVDDVLDFYEVIEVARTIE